MVSRFRTLCAAGAVAMPLVMVAGTPAEAAAADVFVMQGSGTISPGLEWIPQPQSGGFTGTATVLGTDGVLATFGCSFSVSGLRGSIAVEVGTMSGGCGPIQCVSWVYVRVASPMEVECVDQLVASMECIFQPHDVNPTTSYDLICEGRYSRVP